MRILVMSGETWYCVKDSRRADKPLGVACGAVGVLVGWHVAVGSLKVLVSRVDCIAVVVSVRTRFEWATPG